MAPEQVPDGGSLPEVRWVTGKEEHWPHHSLLNSQVIASGILTSVCWSGGQCCQRGRAVLIGPAGEDSRAVFL